MVNIKTTSDYVVAAPDFKPGPKNGHLSAKDPNFAAIEADFTAATAPMWDPGLPLDKFKESWLSAPPAIPDGCPVPGQDVFLSKMKVPVRDGSEVEIQIYRPPEPRTDAALVFRMHGGGWTVGGHEIDEAENRYLGALPNAVVVSVLYRMAPEFPYPYPIDDSWDVLKWCKAHAKYLGIDPERIILVGNSGGGNMAACLAIKARDEGLTGIVAQSLVFPVTCHPKFFSQVPNYELLSWSQNHDSGLLDSYRMEWFWDQYLGTDPKPDPGHSPLLHQLKDLQGLPPAFVQVGGLDPLRDEGIAYAEALKAAGNEVEQAAYPGLPHCFYTFVGFKQTVDYFTRVVGFVKKHADAERQAKSVL
ncbi:hypothetical protein LQW54_004138 [Pestalotiopsis sp. IQ-011]